MYKVYLGNMLLPVTPSKIQTKIKNQNKTINLINGEEINIINSAGLTEISFSFLLPMQKYDFAQYSNGFRSANYFLDQLESRKLKKQNFSFIITRKGITLFNNFRYYTDQIFKTNLLVTLEDYTIVEDSDEGGDITVSIKLKQYVDYGLKVVKLKEKDNKTTATKETKRNTSKEIPTTYTVKAGDTLWVIAKKLLGDGSKCWNLAKLNGISNPNIIRVDQVLKIQDVASSSGPTTSRKTNKTSAIANTPTNMESITLAVSLGAMMAVASDSTNRTNGLTGSSGYSSATGIGGMSALLEDYYSKDNIASSGGRGGGGGHSW